MTTTGENEPDTGFDTTPEPRAGEKATEYDRIAPTGVPLIPDGEAAGLSPWVWGGVHVLITLAVIWYFS